jgi:hypothetical protein
MRLRVGGSGLNGADVGRIVIAGKENPAVKAAGAVPASIAAAVAEETGAGVRSGANPGDRAETSERARTTTAASRLNMARIGA